MDNVTKTCPACSATLNRLFGRDGWEAERAFGARNDGHRVIERRRIAVIYTCPSCEHAEGADQR